MNRRRILFSTIITIISVALIWIGCSKTTSSEIYDSLKDTFLAEINRMADSCLNAGNPEQALTYYTVITGRYDRDKNKANTEDYIRAYNNLGYIYFLYYSDYPKAYQHFLQALEIAESNKYNRIAPMYHNIGNMYFSLGDTLAAISYSKKAFYQALKDSNQYVSITALSDLLALSGLSNNTDSLSDIHRDFRPELLADSVPMKKYALLCHSAMKHILNHDTGKLIDILKQMPQAVNTSYDPERHKANAIALLAESYRTIGDTRNEAIQLITLDSLGKAHAMNDIRIPALRILSENFRRQGDTAMANTYHQTALNLEDSVLNINKVRTIWEMESLYKTEKLNDQIRLINTERRFQHIIIIILAIAFTIVLALGAWIVWRYRVQARYTNALYEKNIQLAKLNKPKLPEPSTPSHQIDNSEKELADKISEIMKSDPRIFALEFTIDSLAEIVGEKKYIVSQVINKHFGMNFNNFLADFRIKEACHRLSDNENYDNLTIEAISESLGFKSRSNFTSQFKKITGLTPTEMIKLSKAKK